MKTFYTAALLTVLTVSSSSAMTQSPMVITTSATTAEVAENTPRGSRPLTVSVPKSRGEILTMDMLADMPEVGVTAIGDGVYTLSQSLSIPEDYIFSLDGVSQLRFGDGVFLEFDSWADFDATADGANPDNRITLTRNADTDKPGGIRMSNNSGAPVTFRNIDFEYLQVVNSGDTGFDVVDCTFYRSGNVISSTAAVAVASSDASFAIRGCTFTECEVPAVGCPANHAVALLIEDCTFIDNNTANTNKPQLNLTVGGDHDLVVRRCTLTGTGRNMVGGIAVGNLTVLPGHNRVYIEGCNIAGHRYGITGVGPMYMEIRDNILLDNCHETNAMNGGSGISLAGYNYGLDAVISGNRIEGSLWGVTLIQCREVNMGEVDNPASPGGNVFRNNGNGGVLYDLYNNQVSDVMAQLNTWGVDEQTPEKIETVIFHKTDDPRLGRVTYLPAADGAGIADAVSTDALTFSDGIISSSRPVTIYRVDGSVVSSSASSINTSTLVPGLYIATDGIHTIKVAIP